MSLSAEIEQLLHSHVETNPLQMETTVTGEGVPATTADLLRWLQDRTNGLVDAVRRLAVEVERQG